MGEVPISQAKNELMPTTGIFDLRLLDSVETKITKDPAFLATDELKSAYQALVTRVSKLGDDVLVGQVPGVDSLPQHRADCSDEMASLQ